MGWDGMGQAGIAMGWDGNGTEKSVPWTSLMVRLPQLRVPILKRKI